MRRVASTVQLVSRRLMLRAAAVPIRLASSIPSFRGSFISKPTGCLNIRVYHPKYKRTKDGYALALEKTGNLSIEIAPANTDVAVGDPQRYNWERKVQFAMMPADIVQLLAWSPVQELKIIKKATPRAAPGGDDAAPSTITRSFSLKASDGGVTATVRTEGGPKSGSASVELSTVEFQILKTHFSVAIPWLTGWMQQINPLTYDEAIHTQREFGSGGAWGSASVPDA